MNKVILSGRLGADPELRTTTNGNSVCNLRVATTYRKKVGDNWESDTDWHRVVVWGNKAELCDKHLEKGGRVVIEGSSRTREWEDKDGNKRWTTEIVASEVEFITWKGDGDNRQTPPADDDVPY